MLYHLNSGCSSSEDNQGTTSAEMGTSVAAGGTQYVKNATYTTLIASLAYDAWGIFIGVYNTAVASTRTSYLLDIAIGAASSEVVIIPNLICGNTGTSAGAQGAQCMFFFPIFIPAGTRISATGAAFTVSDTCNVYIKPLNFKIPGRWYGSRVTAYGVNTGACTGTSMSPGSSTYATPVTLATTSNPIKYMQMACDLLTNASGTSSRGLVKISIGNDAPVLVQDLPYEESTTLESTRFATANFILSHMKWNIPAGVDLRISAMRSTTAATRGWAVYGVD